ncbi:MAG: host specificity factor TipJ family phage tail protein [Deltaproteobacteria bacterium]
MKTLILTTNPLDPAAREEHQVEDVREFLIARFPTWPASARIYHVQVAENCDVTPADEAGIDRLGELPGPFYVVVFPGAFSLIVALIGLAISLTVMIVRAFQVTPNPARRNSQTESPNNALGGRQNQPRPNSRIPDIFGTVRSTPDLLSSPYRIFVEHEEVEYAYLCIGRGSYEVDDVRDGSTPFGDITGASLEVFGPNTSPNHGDPQLRIGEAITQPLLSAKRFDSVNGQTLRPPNARLRGSLPMGDGIRFVYPNRIELQPGSQILFTDVFFEDDEVTVEGAAVGGALGGHWGRWDEGAGMVIFPDPQPALPAGTYAGEQGIYEGIAYYWYVIPGALDGTFLVATVADRVITLDNPAAINATWGTSFPASDYQASVLSTNYERWTDLVTLDVADMNRVYANFVAASGMYKDDGNEQTRTDVQVQLELTPINALGEVTGGSERIPSNSALAADPTLGAIIGSAVTRSSRALTMQAQPSFTGRCKVRARRVTPTDMEFPGQVVDEVKWRDVYAVAPVAEEHFGDVTTVHAVTRATKEAVVVKERKLNMLATRKLYLRTPHGTGSRDSNGFTTTLQPTNRADDILVAICRDPRLGNRPLAELDLTSIYGAVDAVIDYFGHELAGEFNYTFDKSNVSFEEMVAQVAATVFCTAYRRGNVLKLAFERASTDSTLLFNHRNKVPGSETRTVRFGPLDDNDGVELEYVDPLDDMVMTYSLPVDNLGTPTAVNPKRVETAGIRSKLQAHFHACRAWNKIQHQAVNVEFEATRESDLLVRMDRIVVADNTRPHTQDGEVISQNVLTLHLSQPVVFESGKAYTAFLQHYDGTVEGIPVTAGSTDRDVVLSRAPSIPLSLDALNFARATYLIVADDNPREQAFLVTERESKSIMTSTVRAMNYDARYYANDLDYVNDVVDENGEPV